MGEEHPECALHAEKLTNLEKSVNKILKLIQGNGTMGIATKAHLAYEEMQERIKSKNKIKLDVYRWVIFAILGFIAVKVGLK